MSKISHARCTLALFFAASVLPGFGQTNTNTNADASAPAPDLPASHILLKCREAYVAISTYRDSGTRVYEIDGKTLTNSFHETLGNRTCYQVEITTAPYPYSQTDRYWSDGLDNSFTRGESIVFKGMDLAGNLSSTVQDTAVPTLFFNLTWGNLFVPFKLSADTEVVRQPDEKIGDTDCYVVASTSEKYGGTLWIGKQDYLIRRYRHGHTVETHENIIINEQYKRQDFVPPSSPDRKETK